MKYSSPYQKAVGAFSYAQNSIMKAIKSTHIHQSDISTLKRNLDNSKSNPSKLNFNYKDNTTNDTYFRANNYNYKRVHPSLSPIKEGESSAYESKLKTYTNIGTEINQSPPKIMKDEEEYYNQKPSLSSLSNNYFKRLMISIHSFKFDKMLLYNNINIHTLHTTEITVPLLVLVIFMLGMILRGKHWIKSLYLFILVIPILNWFLVNQFVLALNKFKLQMKKIPLIKSITFFYSAFTPICFASLCILILRRRTFVGVFCLISGIIYSSFLNEKYNGLYCGIDINSNSILLMINIVMYAFFILVIV